MKHIRSGERDAVPKPCAGPPNTPTESKTLEAIRSKRYAEKAKEKRAATKRRADTFEVIG